MAFFQTVNMHSQKSSFPLNVTRDLPQNSATQQHNDNRSQQEKETKLTSRHDYNNELEKKKLEKEGKKKKRRENEGRYLNESYGPLLEFFLMKFQSFNPTSCCLVVFDLLVRDGPIFP